MIKVSYKISCQSNLTFHFICIPLIAPAPENVWFWNIQIKSVSIRQLRAFFVLLPGHEILDEILRQTFFFWKQPASRHKHWEHACTNMHVGQRLRSFSMTTVAFHFHRRPQTGSICEAKHDSVYLVLRHEGTQPTGKTHALYHSPDIHVNCN